MSIRHVKKLAPVVLQTSHGRQDDEGADEASVRLLPQTVTDSAAHSQSPLPSPIKYAGRLTNIWSLITRDFLLLSYIQGYKIPFCWPVVQSCLPEITHYCNSERALFDKAIKELLSFIFVKNHFCLIYFCAGTEWLDKNGKMNLSL